MPPHAHLDGPALRALASVGHLPFVPPQAADPADKPRDRIWDLADTLHCSIVGTCLTNAEARAILATLGRPDARTISKHRLHGEMVQIAGRKEGGARLLQKALDRRHEREIEWFAQARSPEAVRTLWKASLERGGTPGAYWAAITYPATDSALVQEIFGEVHMLSHLVGQSSRLLMAEGAMAARRAAPLSVPSSQMAANRRSVLRSRRLRTNAAGEASDMRRVPARGPDRSTGDAFAKFSLARHHPQNRIRDLLR